LCKALDKCAVYVSLAAMDHCLTSLTAVFIYRVNLGVQKEVLKHMHRMWDPYTRSVDCSCDVYCIQNRKKWWIIRTAAQGANLWGTLRHHWN